MWGFQVYKKIIFFRKFPKRGHPKGGKNTKTVKKLSNFIRIYSLMIGQMKETRIKAVLQIMTRQFPKN